MPQSPQLRAILQALLVTFLWSTSWVLIKIRLDDIPPLIFAGLRYTLAFVILGLFIFRAQRPAKNPVKGLSMRQLTRRDWILLTAQGLIYYAITQGTLFLALIYLPSVTFSLMLNFTTLIVAFFGIIFLREIPVRHQWFGIGIFLAGVLLYFHPLDLQETSLLGLIIGSVSVLANSGATVLGRYINRTGHINARIVTLVSMGIGGILLLIAGILIEGIPTLELVDWLVILWLAVVNTAFAFTLWNVTQQVLSATETSIINNTMLIQIAVLAWIFLGEDITLSNAVALGIAAVGILIVQLPQRRKKHAALGDSS